MSSEKRGTIGSFALLGMTVAAVFGIKNIINNNAAIGLAAAPSFFFATLLYFVPYTLVTAEFVGLNKDSVDFQSQRNSLNGPRVSAASATRK